MIESKASGTRLEVVLKVEPNIRILTPIRAVSDAVRARFSDIQLADEPFHVPAIISLILGADMYPKIIHQGFLNVDEGLPAEQKTEFGWIISGACNQT